MGSFLALVVVVVLQAVGAILVVVGGGFFVLGFFCCCFLLPHLLHRSCATKPTLLISALQHTSKPTETEVTMTAGQ